MSKVQVATTINGERLEFLCDPEQTMLEVLREELGLTGTKEGCGTGDCGACSILLNDRLICSCLMLAVESAGQSLTTVEGISPAGTLHPIQRVFLEEAALQCGVCTPGLMVAAKSLLARNADPSEEEIRYWLAGNLCRCTGYDKIIRAVQIAARELRETPA
jgi:aerobic carbon-monoxide dehydrogenase small subunit